jgi:hypothetical protein
MIQKGEPFMIDMLEQYLTKTYSILKLKISINIRVEKYGPIVKVNFLNYTIVHTVDPDAVKVKH